MWVDIVMFAILAIFLVIGLWKGLFDSLLSLISTGVALTISILVAKPATSFIAKIVNIPAWFESLLGKAMGDGTTIELFGIKSLEFTKSELANFLSVVFSVVVVFILIKLAVWLLAKLFDSVVENSGIGSGLNRVLGGLFGLVKGGIIVLVILAFCSILSGTQLFGDKINATINKSTCTNYVYKYVSEFTEKTLEKADIKDFVSDLVRADAPEETE